MHGTHLFEFRVLEVRVHEGSQRQELVTILSSMRRLVKIGLNESHHDASNALWLQQTHVIKEGEREEVAFGTVQCWQGAGSRCDWAAAAATTAALVSR